MSEAVSFAEFVQRVGVMKPGSAKKDDLKNVVKVEKLLDDPEWILEEKVDGCRYQIFGHRFFSSDGVEKTDNFPHLKQFFEKLRMHNLILDGEIYYPGKTSQYCTHVTGSLPSGAIHFQKTNGYIHYILFDILRSPKSNWTIRNTYMERRRLLQYFFDTFIKGTDMEAYIHMVPMVSSGKREYLQQLLDSGLEGGVLKRLDSLYHMGKKPMWQWMKVKQNDDTDLIVMGFEPATVLYTGNDVENWTYWAEVGGIKKPVTKWHYNGWVGNVILGAYVNGAIRQICTASGMKEDVRADMSTNPDKYLGKVARVTFMEKTADGFPRHPAFKNMHEGKRPEECIWQFD